MLYFINVFSSTEGKRSWWRRRRPIRINVCSYKEVKLVQDYVKKKIITRQKCYTQKVNCDNPYYPLLLCQKSRYVFLQKNIKYDIKAIQTELCFLSRMYSIEILTGSWYAVSEDMLRCCCHGNDVVRDLFDCRSYIYIIYIMRRFFTELRNSRSKPIRVARMDVRHVRRSE